MNSEVTANRDMAVSQALPLPLWRNRDYVLIVVAGAVSAVGTKVSQIALPLLVLGLTQSPVWAGLLGAARLLPYLLISLPAGVWVDRVNRKRLLVACDLVRGWLFATIPLAYYFGILTILQLFVVMFVVGICTVLFEVADLSALPHVVHGSQLAHARSLSEGIEATATVVGPSLGGFMVGLGRTVVSGSVLAYLVDSLSYIISGVALLTVRRALQVPDTQAPPPLREAMREGLGFLWRHPTLRPLMILTTIVNFLQAPISLFVILVAQQRFALSPERIGLLFGMAGTAAVLGSALAGWWYRVERLRVILVGSLIFWALSALTLAFAPSALILTAGLGLTYLVWPIYAVAVVSYRLSETPDHLHGRVISAFRTLSYGAEPLGMAVGGLALMLASPRLLFMLIGVALLLCVGVVMRARISEMRRAA
jgi:MFS family permease